METEGVVAGVVAGMGGGVTVLVVTCIHAITFELHIKSIIVFTPLVINNGQELTPTITKKCALPSAAP
jgi:predicted lysophospholipase L1 biosynthesis ABC-type transport system permease subunit